MKTHCACFLSVPAYASGVGVAVGRRARQICEGVLRRLNVNPHACMPLHSWLPNHVFVKSFKMYEH